VTFGVRRKNTSPSGGIFSDLPPSQFFPEQHRKPLWNQRCFITARQPVDTAQELRKYRSLPSFCRESPGSEPRRSSCLLVRVLREPNPGWGAGTDGQGVPGQGCWERFPFTSESISSVREGQCGPRVFSTAPSMAGFRSTTEALLQYKQVNTNERRDVGSFHLVEEERSKVA